MLRRKDFVFFHRLLFNDVCHHLLNSMKPGTLTASILALSKDWQILPGIIDKYDATLG